MTGPPPPNPFSPEASPRERILAFAATALNNAVGLLTKPAGLTVERMRLGEIEVTELPHMNVRPTDESVSLGNDPNPRASAIIRTLSFIVEIRTLAALNQSADASADKYLQWASLTLQADITLGANAIHILEVGTKWAAEDTGSGRFCLATRTYKVVYPTKRTDEGVKP